MIFKNHEKPKKSKRNLKKIMKNYSKKIRKFLKKNMNSKIIKEKNIFLKKLFEKI